MLRQKIMSSVCRISDFEMDADECKDACVDNSCISVWNPTESREEINDKYKILHGNFTWNQAKQACASQGMRIATIRTHEDHGKVRNMLETPGSLVVDALGNIVSDMMPSEELNAVADLTKHIASVNMRKEAWIGLRTEKLDGKHVMGVGGGRRC